MSALSSISDAWSLAIWGLTHCSHLWFPDLSLMLPALVSNVGFDHHARLTGAVVSASDSLKLDSRSIVQLTCSAERGIKIRQLTQRCHDRPLRCLWCLITIDVLVYHECSLSTIVSHSIYTLFSSIHASSFNVFLLIRIFIAGRVVFLFHNCPLCVGLCLLDDSITSE